MLASTINGSAAVELGTAKSFDLELCAVILDLEFHAGPAL
jgi:hypothetical protein